VCSSDLAGLGEDDPADPDERIQIQGIIDCLFEEPEGLVLIDYKTDAVSAEEALARAAVHRSQIALYARAVDAIFPVPLKEGFIHFLAPGRTVPIALG